MENTKVEVTFFVEKENAHPLLRFAGILSEEEADNMLKIIEEEFEPVQYDQIAIKAERPPLSLRLKIGSELRSFRVKQQVGFTG